MADNDAKNSGKKSSSTHDKEMRLKNRKPYMQNRELSWLEFNKRVLDQGADPNVPLLERLQFVSIFSSNLQEFFMVRVGSITDLSLLKQEVIDTKSQMTPSEQLDAIYARCHELYPIQEEIYAQLETELSKAGVSRLQFGDLNEEQVEYLRDWMNMNVLPFLTPQIINARHPFPHLESGGIYLIVRLTEMNTKSKKEMTAEERHLEKEERKRLKNLGAEGVMLGIIPLPKQAPRVIPVPGEGFQYILLEDAMEALVGQVFSMYNVKHTNIICVTRNADLDATEGADGHDDDYREYMKKILKKRSRLAPVRLESKRKLSETVAGFLLPRLELKEYQTYITSVPFNMGSYAFSLPSMVEEDTRKRLTSVPFVPAWPAEINHKERIIDQVQKRDLLISYPYESMDPFVQLLREAAADPEVVSIRITLYRLASRSQLAEALISACDAGKEVTALFELRARFDESNNIRWSQLFEEAGCNVIYGFHDYKVHSKICSIVRHTAEGYQCITQLGTGNYNEKTARLYTDFCYITANKEIGKDATTFFRNMGMESTSRDYDTIIVAPLQIKQTICSKIDEQIALAKEGKPCGLFFKTNSITDREIIEKLAEASQAKVPTTLLVRGISCIIPGLEGYTDNIRVVSIVGRLLEHSRIYGFGQHSDMELYLSSADLMTRNMDKRIEVAWPVRDEASRAKVLDYIDTCLADTAKLRELKPDCTFTDLGELASEKDRAKGKLFNAQEDLIRRARKASDAALKQALTEESGFDKLKMQAHNERQKSAQKRAATSDIEDIFREALQHEMPKADDEALRPFLRAASKTAAKVTAEMNTKLEAAQVETTEAQVQAAKAKKAVAQALKQAEQAQEEAAQAQEEAAQAQEEATQAQEEAAQAQAKFEKAQAEFKEVKAAPAPAPSAAPAPSSQPTKKKGFFSRLFGK